MWPTRADSLSIALVRGERKGGKLILCYQAQGGGRKKTTKNNEKASRVEARNLLPSINKLYALPYYFTVSEERGKEKVTGNNTQWY